MKHLKKSLKYAVPSAKPEHVTPEGRPFKVQRSWLTEDSYELDKRRVAALEEKNPVSPLPLEGPLFKNYQVQGKNDQYTVELRSLTEHCNTCSCPDFRKNFLGTCKHIERVLQLIASEKQTGTNPSYELYMGREPYAPRLLRPAHRIPKLSALFDLYFDKKGEMYPEGDLHPLVANLDRLPQVIRQFCRISQEIREWLAKQTETDHMAKLRESMERRMAQNDGKLPFLKEQLYDYQKAGMLHLAFKGRAILADDMGLGKTVQAVAAAAVMRHTLGIKRVLVISPSSLKLEWEEQIRKFTDFSSSPVFGGKGQRIEFFKNTDVFFVLMNYEQVLRDAKEIMEFLKPDLMILDEAQRIKNWTTQTARVLKAMEPPYVFVLTGTPLENRIDDIYSLTEIVDPTIFGSLFRFNRRYYKFDEEGKMAGMQNLDELHKKLGGIMLRRRKAEVQLSLPQRSQRNLFVSLTEEQKRRYEENSMKLSRLLCVLKKRNLTQDEFQLMQLYLANMRMLCDSCYITDGAIKESPKLDELMLVLYDYLENDPERKIIVFSEWVRMLDLLKERLDEQRIHYVEHTGSIPQLKRRAMLDTFKNQRDCRILLSSESGGTGLNLQAASVVINLDLPWNPAKLEQRIARAWRNKQTRDVDVVNLVSENTIEHAMLGTLQYKSELADLVLDGTGDPELFSQQNAREAFVKRLQELLSKPQAQKRAPSLAEKIHDGKLALDSLFACTGLDGTERLLGVGQEDAANVQKVTEEQRPITIISSEVMAALQQLAQQGIITFNQDGMKQLYNAEAQGTTEDTPEDAETVRRRELALACLEKATRPVKMAAVLLENDFQEEAVGSIWNASHLLEQSLELRLYGQSNQEDEQTEEAFLQLMKDCAALPEETRQFLEQCHGKMNADDKRLQAQCTLALSSIRSFLQR